MYNINDIVMYGAAGICRINAIEKRNFSGKELEYYVLKHIPPDKNTIYVPTDNAAALDKMHTVCSRNEVDSLIANMNAARPLWIDDNAKRKEEYGGVIKRADKQELIRLIKALYLKRKDLRKEGKKLNAADENYLNTAENMLFEEFAYALGIEPSEVVDYIQKHIV